MIECLNGSFNIMEERTKRAKTEGFAPPERTTILSLTEIVKSLTFDSAAPAIYPEHEFCDPPPLLEPEHAKQLQVEGEQVAQMLSVARVNKPKGLEDEAVLSRNKAKESWSGLQAISSSEPERRPD
jgi:hypothetical protein